MNDLLEPVLGAERWPPMLGVVGFDGGYKSAVALAIPPEGLVAGEGEFGPGEGIGACCYDDGTCDDISEFDCTSAGGTYQGDGTDCASVTCTGVCCEPGCVDDTTPDGCSLDGGTFQGFGTTCDDDPPPCPETTTGACCIDGECSILSEDDCSSADGRYEGDGTDCDPNPCPPPSPCCISSGFDAFDGSCRKFLTKTIVVSVAVSFPDLPLCPGVPRNSSWDSTTTQTIDPETCELSCECSGSGECNAVGLACAPCNTPLTGDTCGGDINCSGTTGFGGFSGCEVSGNDGCGIGNRFECGGCGGTGSCSTDVASATEQTITCDNVSNPTWHGTRTETLSDECATPPCATGACCDYGDNSCSITTAFDCSCVSCSYAGDDTICPDDCFFSAFADPFFRSN